MVAKNSISAVLVSTDLETSRGFYEDKVGLKFSPGTIKNHLLFDCGNGTTLLIYGRGSGNKADHTHVRFWSTDIVADVAELVDRGIEFEEYDMDAFKDDHPRRDVARDRPFGLVQRPGRQHDRALPARVITADIGFGAEPDESQSNRPPAFASDAAAWCRSANACAPCGYDAPSDLDCAARASSSRLLSQTSERLSEDRAHARMGRWVSLKVAAGDG